MYCMLSGGAFKTIKTGLGEQINDTVRVQGSGLTARLQHESTVHWLLSTVQTPPERQGYEGKKTRHFPPWLLTALPEWVVWVSGAWSNRIAQMGAWGKAWADSWSSSMDFASENVFKIKQSSLNVVRELVLTMSPLCSRKFLRNASSALDLTLSLPTHLSLS